MGELVLGTGFDMVGEDDDMEGDFMVGARKSRRIKLARKKARVPTPGWMNATTSQGVSRPQEEMDYLPFEAAVIAIGALTGVLISQPQRPFRPERIVLDAIAGGVSAVANCVIDPAIFVGAVQVGAAQGSAPIAVFRADAFGVRLSMPAVGQGTTIRIPIRLLAASASVTTVTGVLIGRAMR